ncbi:MAG: ATP-binding protein [Clostridia bacterium]|nr:ATP-binding protein [Clostridia bacterium]
MALWEFKIKADKQEIPAVVESIKAKLARVRAFNREAIIAVSVEMLSNIAEYAYSGEGYIIIELIKAKDKVTITFKDSGRPFNPGDVHNTEQKDGRGLGIIIARNMTDRYDYTYCDGMNISVFEKNI